MVAHVQTKTLIGGSGTSGSVTISSTAGNTLVLVADAYYSTNAAYHVSSISDSHNTWSFSTAASNQNPPAGESWSGAYTGLIAAGAVVSAAAITSVTVTFSASLDYFDLIVYEFSGVTAGASIVVAGASSTLVTAASVTTPSVTVPGSASLAVAAQTNVGNSGSATTVGSGWTLDAGADNSAAYRLSPAAGALTATFTSTGSQQWPSSAILVIGTSSTPHAAAAALSGTGTLTAAGLVTQPAAAALSGGGTLAGTVAVAIPSAAFLLGTGTLTAAGDVTAPGQVSASLAGTGTLTTPLSAGWAQAATLSGSGTLSATYTGLVLQGAALSGTGTLTVAAAEALQFTAGLFGAGFLSIPQVAGGLVNGVGGASTPQALPGSSQVAVAPPGSSSWQWLGTLGQVTALTYSYVCPGGADKMSMTIMCPASFRTQLFNPGWKVKITRGGHQVWDGVLDEPQPSAQGWTLTAVGTGNLSANYVAYYSVDDVYPAGEPDEIINRAIARGLPWVNPGLNSSPYFSQFWMGQATDPGSTTVTAFLNLICTRGGLTWYVNSQPGGVYNGDDLRVFPLPTVPNRLLVSTTPVARTLGGYYNAILMRFCTALDNTTANTPAEYSVASAINYQSQATHGVLETYVDLSDVGVMTSAQALAVGYSLLALYQAAAYAGPFQVSYGQLLNMGGQAIDPGTDQAGNMAKLILTDFGYGGQVVPNIPITFVIGQYSWDDYQQVATVTPLQTLDMSLTGLLSAWNTTNVPLSVAGG